MMLIYVSILLVFVTCVRNGHGAPTTTVKSEKPLFVPSVGDLFVASAGNPTIYGTGRLESAAHFSPYAQNYDSTDLLQRQPSYAPIERVLQILHHRGENRKLPPSANHADEDDYKRNSNNLLSSEQLSPELEDLDRKYKRSTAYWNSPPTVKRPEPAAATYRAPTLNSRAVNERPFGPYSTWSALTTSSSSSWNAAGRANANNNRPVVRRRRHDNEGNDDIIGGDADGGSSEIRDDTPTLLQYAPAYNTYTLFPAHLESLHTRFVRDMPLQYSVVYEPAYPIGRKTSENLALLTNSLLVNAAAPNAHADEPEKYAAY